MKPDTNFYRNHISLLTGVMTLCCSLMLVSLQAQVSDTIYTSQGRIYQVITTEGDHKRVQTFTSGGTVEKDEFFRDGKKHGVQKEFYTSGEIKVEAHYNNGIQDGSYREYYRGKVLSKQLRYKKFVIDGQPAGLPDGEALYYFNNGTIARQGDFKKGKEEGKWTFYNQNGHISEEKEYKNGKMAGIHITYYANGQLQSKAEVYEDVTIDNVHYEKLIMGWSRRYYDNGIEESAVEMKDGVATGNEKRWFRNGVLKSEGIVTGEGLRKSQYYDDKGMMTLYVEEKRVMKDGYPRWVKHGEERWYKEGKLTSRSHYWNGENHGTFEKYALNGQLTASGEVFHGKTVGVYKSFYESGAIQNIRQNDLIIQWRGDTGVVENGWQRNFAENGQVTYEAYVDMGEEAYRAQYHENGDLISRFFQIQDIKWSQEYYPGNILKTDHLSGWYYEQKALWLINDVQHLLLIKSFYKNEHYYEFKRSGSGDLLSVIIDGKDIPPDSVDIDGLEFRKGDFYVRNPPDGEYALKYGSGEERLTFSLKNGQIDGAFKVYRPDGSLALYAEMKEGLSRGESCFLNSDGDTLMYGRRGELKEKYRKVWQADSSLRINKYDKRGNSLYNYESYPGGSPKMLSDDEHKIYRSWNPDGTISSEQYPVEGDSGRTVHLDYYQHGQLRTRYHIRESRRDGMYESYYENGQLNMRTVFKEGEQHGPYISYFEDGSLRSKGDLVNGKKEGKWVVALDGKPATQYYVNDRLQVKLPESKCACLDTTYVSNTYGYLNSLSSLVEYRKFRNLTYPFLQPMDSLAFRSLFYKDHYGRSLDLISFKPIILLFEGEGKNTLTLNACHTTGYLSAMDIHVYDYEGLDNYRIAINKPNLKYTFTSKNFMQDYSSIDLWINPDRLLFDTQDHIIFDVNLVEPCFEPIIKGSWKLESAVVRILPGVSPVKADRWYYSLMNMETVPREFFKDTVTSKVQANGAFIDSTTSRIFSTEFRKQVLHGFIASSGSGSIVINGTDVPFSLRYLWMTNNWATGAFELEIATYNEKDEFTIIQSGKTIKSSIVKLDQKLKSEGFSATKMTKYPNQNRIRIEFFVQ